LANVKLKQGKTEETVGYLRSAVEYDPELFEAQYALGIQLMNTNRVAEAIEALEAAVRLRPKYEPTRYHLALALQRQNEFEESLAHFDRLLELNPDSTPALSQAAYIRATCPQQELRDYEAAVQMAERACELTNNSDPEFLATLASVYIQVGRQSDAVTASRRAAMIARNRGREDFARRIERDFGQYWQQSPAASAEEN
jgi:tetratricopeptide (TPR) repeat protein